MAILLIIFSLVTLLADFVVNQLAEQPWLFSFIAYFFISVPRLTVLRISSIIYGLMMLIWAFPYFCCVKIMAIMGIALGLRECFYLLFWEVSRSVELFVALPCILILHVVLNGWVAWSFFQLFANIGMILLLFRLRFLHAVRMPLKNR